MRHKVDLELLFRYFRGACTDKEAEAVRLWMEAPENEQELQEMMQTHWEQMAPEAAPEGADLEQLLPAIHDRMRADQPLWLAGQEQELAEEPAEADPPRPFGRLWRIAASLLLPALLLTGYFYARQGAITSEGALVMQEKANPAAQQSRIVLPDGTRVWLNYASTLHYPEHFAGETREVYLEGEAFFEVVKKEAQPFVVHTKGINIRVLGTSFNVKSYLEDETVETTLSTGMVLIEENPASAGAKIKEPVVLKPSQKASFSKTTGQITLDEVDVRLHTAWKEEILVFRNEPYGNVMKQLERRFGVTIHLTAPGAGACGLTAKFQNESLEEILEIITRTSGLSYSVAGDSVQIKGSFCE